MSFLNSTIIYVELASPDCHAVESKGHSKIHCFNLLQEHAKVSSPFSDLWGCDDLSKVASSTEMWDKHETDIKNGITPDRTTTVSVGD